MGVLSAGVIRVFWKYCWRFYIDGPDYEWLMIAAIPPRKNRIVQREYDKDLYKLRHLLENALFHVKR